MPRSFVHGLRLALLGFLVLSLCACFGSTRGGNGGGYQPSRAPAPKRNLACLPGQHKISPAVFSNQPSPHGLSLFPDYFKAEPVPTAPAVYPDSEVEAFGRSLSRFTLIVGAMYDLNEKRLTVVGEIDPTKPPVDPDDFFVALRAAKLRQEVGVTIDPCPTSHETMDVRHFGKTEDTHHGYVTYATDLFMKMGGIAHDNHSCEPVLVDIPGFQSEIDRIFALPPEQSGESWHRFWIEPSVRRVKRSKDKSRVLFDVVPHVKTEHFGGVMNNTADKAAQGYAAFYTDNYEELERAYPVFYHLRQLFYMDTLAKWLADNRAQLDHRWFDYRPKSMQTPRSVPAVSVFKRGARGNFVSTLALYGGVSFRNKNQYESLPADGLLAAAQTAGTDTDFEFEGRRFATVSWESEKPYVVLDRNREWPCGSIRRAPLVKRDWQPQVTAGQARATFDNTTPYMLKVVFQGTGYGFSIPAMGSHTIDLPPGHYDFLVSAPSANVSGLLGKLELSPGRHSRHRLSIVTHTY